MNLPRRQLVSDALNLIADLIQEADSFLREAALPRPKLKDGVEPHKRSSVERMERRVAEKLTPMSRDVFRARRERKARSRYHTLKNVKTPRKVLGSRLRTR